MEASQLALELLDIAKVTVQFVTALLAFLTPIVFVACWLLIRSLGDRRRSRAAVPESRPRLKHDLLFGNPEILLPLSSEEDRKSSH